MTTNSFVAECPACGEETCLNNVHHRGGELSYKTKECWTCGYNYRHVAHSNLRVEFTMTDEEREELRSHMEDGQ